MYFVKTNVNIYELIETKYLLFVHTGHASLLILILIDVKYLQNIVFSFEKGLNGQNHSSSGSHHPVKKFPPQ